MKLTVVFGKREIEVVARAIKLVLEQSVCGEHLREFRIINFAESILLRCADTLIQERQLSTEWKMKCSANGVALKLVSPTTTISGWLLPTKRLAR